MRWDARQQSDVWKYFDLVAKADDGAPKVICKRCKRVLDHPQQHGNGTAAMVKHLKGIGCRGTKGPGIKQFLQEAAPPSNSLAFTQEAWEANLLRFITDSRLPFQILEHPDFHHLIYMASRAPGRPHIPSAKTVRRRLQDTIAERQNSILQKLPRNGKLSVALDCWTSPFQQAFMAVTGYFLDEDWNYQEMLLGLNRFMGHTQV